MIYGSGDVDKPAPGRAMFAQSLAAEFVPVNAPASLRMKNISHPLLLSMAIALACAACAPNVDVRGNLPHNDQLSQVKVGKSTRDEVLALFGTPSAITPFGSETWHYISARTETTAFFEPQVTDRKVVTVVFDARGVVKDFATRGLEDSKAVDPVERETPTAGKEMNLLQQLLGNLGRFSKDPAVK